MWDVVADRANDPRWCPKVERVEPADGDRWNVWHKPVRLRPAALLETEHIREEPPRSLTMREEDDASVFVVEYRLDPTPAGTSFTQVSEFRWKRLPRPLQPIFAYGVKRDVRAQLRNLKRLVEAEVGY